MKGWFEGKYERRKTGEHARWLFWKVPLYEYQSDPIDPLRYYSVSGYRIEPDRHILPSDGMSSPPILWRVKGLAQTDFPMSVYYHDSATRYGGVYINGQFRLASWQQVNAWLYEMVIAEGGTMAQAGRIYAGVTLGMPWIWDGKKQAANRYRDGVSITAA